MSDDFWEEQFNAYTFESGNGKHTSKDVEPEPASSLDEDSALSHAIAEPATSHNEGAVPAIIGREKKLQENKGIYDLQLAKVVKQKDLSLNEEEIENVIVQLEGCITELKYMMNLGSQPAVSCLQHREARRQRIGILQLKSIADVFIAAKAVAECLVEIKKPEYYRFLTDNQFTTLATMTTRTFHHNTAGLISPNPQSNDISIESLPTKDSLNKITTSAGRLAMSVAEVISTFPDEGDLGPLLEMIIQKNDIDTIESVENTLRMSVKDLL